MLSNLKVIAQRGAICNQRITLGCTQRSFSTSFITRQEQQEPPVEQKNIERETLLILQDSITKEKAKPLADVGQRYQKIHHAGDIYHPQDLNDARYQDQLRQRRGRPNVPSEDPFDVLGLDPLHEYKNYRLLSHFVSDMGKILPREKTGLTAKNQRKLAKAVKRARAMGIMCSTTKHTSGFSRRF
ncbi:ribosomal protein S18 [Halteromyces radiatus]|uniref:ribosomal protein S18 n=1 Tax=Halteromyces radiatus TaxID=101107 RepID=UPI00221F8ABA|nr:ribosomal protein S18 [Halteromyces radiatus]KAI8097421.1 ribosomal protein S18 [Halteromyces radiatus]